MLSRCLRWGLEASGKQLFNMGARVHTVPKGTWAVPRIQTLAVSLPNRKLSVPMVSVHTCSSPRSLFTVPRLSTPLLEALGRTPHNIIQTRSIVRYSWHSGRRTVVRCGKRGKRKTCKAVAKRFRRTGSGNLKYWPAGKSHRMLVKSRKRRLQLRKRRYTTKVQLKTLNKMLAGY